MPRLLPGLFCLSLSVLAPALRAAAPLVVTAGPERVTLLELYSSEGCSSCPPADAWLGKLTGDPRLWRRLVPIAFQVDYWDNLGWRDRFASPANTARQRAYAARWASDTVYTPEFVVNGQEWRGWFNNRAVPDTGGGAPGILRAEIHATDLAVTFVPAATSAADPPLELHVALLGFGLASSVHAGENSGRRLSHDFLVLDHSYGLMKAAETGFSAQLPLPAREKYSATRYAIALWISHRGDPRPLQAAGAWLP